MLPIMYCPHCGAQNIKETKFCRGCGEDLRLVSQAVTKSLPLVIAHRVDEAIDRGRGGWRSYQLFRTEHRKAFSHVLMGLSSLFVIVWFLLLGRGNASFAHGFLLVMAATLLISGVRDLWSETRQEKRVEKERLSSLSTKELPASGEAYINLAGSVTESTTRTLKVESRQKPRKDEYAKD
jgi:ribosomal protein L40E